MKIYLAIKYHHDLSNKSLIESLSSHLEAQGHQISNVHRDLEKWGAVELSPEDLMDGAFQFIDECDVVLIEFSEKGVGIGIEAGYAFSRRKPIFTIARMGSDISTTLRGVSKEVQEYRQISEIKVDSTF